MSGRDPNRHFEDIVQDLHRERRRGRRASRNARPKTRAELERARLVRWTVGVALAIGAALAFAFLVPA